MTRIVVIGVGNAMRRDDAAGLAVAERVRAQAPPGVEVEICELEPSRLVDAFGDAEAAFIVDAVRTGAPAGTIHRFDAGSAPIPSHELRSSTHALGIGETLEVARALGRLPRHTVVFGVEGEDFLAGEGMTPAVEAGVAQVSGRVLEEVAECTSRR